MRDTTILVIEDEERMRRLLDLVLQTEGYRVVLANSGEAGLKLAGEGGIDLILTDLQMGQIGGLVILDHVVKDCPDVPVIIITGFGTVQSAVEAMKKGAFDYISKPIDNDELKIVVKRALEMRRLARENLDLSRTLREQYGFDNIVGRSSELTAVKERARNIAATESAILITGESGTGKELLARAIHYASPRAGGPLVVINCAVTPEHLLESELFGDETGGQRTKPGRCFLAHRGTLFLDEIGEMSHGTQAKLFQLLDDHAVDLRLLAATNHDIRDLIKTGKFREDLFYRLSVCPLHLPALRDRKGDIPLLLAHFFARFNRERGTRMVGLTPEALRLVEAYAWPGNIRELQNMVEWVTITCKQALGDVDNLPGYLKASQTHLSSLLS